MSGVPEIGIVNFQSWPEPQDDIDRLARVAAFTLPLTAELLVKAGIAPGMRVLNVGSQAGDVAFQIADRVGTSGSVLAIDEAGELVEAARMRARKQCLHHVMFRGQRLSDVQIRAPFDAVVASFFLSSQADPVQSIRKAASLVRPGGRLIFQEWHWGSMLWTQGCSRGTLPLYREFARRTLHALEKNGTRVDMGLQLAGAVLKAGLPVPALRTDLQATGAAHHPGYVFLKDSLRDLLPEADSFTARVQREIRETGGCLYFPLQVGAWVHAA